MKVIPIRRDGTFKSLEVFEQAISLATPGRSFNIDGMAQRVRVLKIIRATDADATGLLLEDADHQTLWRALDTDAWSVATPELLQIMYDVRDAKEPPPLPSASSRKRRSSS